MNHSKILKREDGTKVDIKASATIDFNSDVVRYSISVYKCEPGKRKYINVHDSDDYQFRRLSAEERKDHIRKTVLSHVTEDEIYKVQLELWEKMKPTANN